MAKKSLRWRGEDRDIEDILKFVESSYELEFGRRDFKNVETFGEFSDKVISKIKLIDVDDSTDLQGSHKLNEAIEKIKGVRGIVLEPSTKLTDIFPRKGRRKDISKIEKTLSVNLRAFKTSKFVNAALLVFFLIIAFAFMIDWKIGLIGLILLMISSWIANKTTNIFVDKTLGELTERMIIYNYIKSRQNPLTVNKKEIEEKIRRLFIDNWNLKVDDIGRETVIV